MACPSGTSATRQRRLWEAYALSGFRPHSAVSGVFGDPKSRVLGRGNAGDLMNSKAHLLANARQHANQRIDRELVDLVIYHI